MTGRRHLSAQCRRAVLVEHAADETRRVRAASRSDAGQKSCGPRGRRRRLTAPRALSEPSVALTERTIALSESKLISVRAKFALTELGGALTEPKVALTERPGGLTERPCPLTERPGGSLRRPGRAH